MVAMTSSSEKVRPGSQGSREAGMIKCVPGRHSGFQMLPAEALSIAVALTPKSCFGMMEG